MINLAKVSLKYHELFLNILLYTFYELAMNHLDEIWNTAVENIINNCTDEQERTIIKLCSTQINLSIENNKIKFLCQSPYISETFIKYSSTFYCQLTNLLNRKDLGMVIDIATNNTNNNNSASTNYVTNANSEISNLSANTSSLTDSYDPDEPIAPGSLLGSNYDTSYQAQVSADFLNSNPIAEDNITNNQSSNVPTGTFVSNGAIIPKEHIGFKQTPINPEKTFENFIVDTTNYLPYSTAISIASKPGDPNNNPFYLYGNSGLGKTHLLFAIANRLKQTKPGISIVYTRAEEFIKHFVASMISKNQIDPVGHQRVFFQNLYTQNDVFIVDDIQTLIKGEHARDAFFQIVADFLDKPNRQLILASDVPPPSLDQKIFPARLTSRFGAGVTLEIVTPTVEARTAIVVRKTTELNTRFDDNVIDFIARNVKSNIRELEGAVKTLYNYQRVHNKLDIDVAQSLLASLINASNQTTSVDDIIERVSKDFDVSAKSLSSPDRKKMVSLARSTAMYITKELLPAYSLSEIGQVFNKDHSSVHEAIKRIATKIDEDRAFSVRVQKLIVSLKKV